MECLHFVSPGNVTDISVSEFGSTKTVSLRTIITTPATVCEDTTKRINDLHHYFGTLPDGVKGSARPILDALEEGLSLPSCSHLTHAQVYHKGYTSCTATSVSASQFLSKTWQVPFQVPPMYSTRVRLRSFDASTLNDTAVDPQHLHKSPMGCILGIEGSLPICYQHHPRRLV